MVKIKKKYIEFKSGFIRFNNNVEINWDFSEWAIPLSISHNLNLTFIRFLFVSVIF